MIDFNHIYLQNGRQFVFLADAYRHDGQFQLALQCVVQGIRLIDSNLNDLITCWVKIKVDVQDQKRDATLLARSVWLYVDVIW